MSLDEAEKKIEVETSCDSKGRVRRVDELVFRFRYGKEQVAGCVQGQQQQHSRPGYRNYGNRVDQIRLAYGS